MSEELNQKTETSLTYINICVNEEIPYSKEREKFLISQINDALKEMIKENRVPFRIYFKEKRFTPIGQEIPERVRVVGHPIVMHINEGPEG